MTKSVKSKNILVVDIPEKYICNLIINPIDDLFIGAINYLRCTGKSCEFFGFNILNGHVALIDGVKYCTNGISVYNGYSDPVEKFYLVEDLDYDYNENRFSDRVNEILYIIGNKKNNL